MINTVPAAAAGLFKLQLPPGVNASGEGILSRAEGTFQGEMTTCGEAAPLPSLLLFLFLFGGFGFVGVFCFDDCLLFT